MDIPTRRSLPEYQYSMAQIATHTPYSVPARSKVTRIEGPNGLTVVVEQQQCSILCVSLGFRMGASDERLEHAGVYHLLEHALVRHLKKCSMELPCGPLLVNGRTTYYSTSISIVALSQDIDSALALISKVWTLRSFSERELRSEVAVILSEIGSRVSRPDLSFARQAFDRLLGERFGVPVEGHEDSVRCLSVLDVEEYCALLKPRNAVLGLVGDLDLDITQRLLAQVSFPPTAGAGVRGPRPEGGACQQACPAATAGSTRRVRACKPQGHLAVAIPCVLHKDRPALELFACLLNHCNRDSTTRSTNRMEGTDPRFGIRIVDMGPFPTVMILSGPLPGDAKASLQLRTVRDLASICLSSASDAELAGLKQRIQVDWAVEQRKPEMRAAVVCQSQLLGDWALGDRFVAKIAHADRSCLERALSEYLVPERLVIARSHSWSPVSCLGPESTASGGRRAQRSLQSNGGHNSGHRTWRGLALGGDGLGVDGAKGRTELVGIAAAAILFVRVLSSDAREREASGLAALALESELVSRQMSRGLRVTSFTSKDAAGLVVTGTNQHLPGVVPQLLDLVRARSLSRGAFMAAKRQRMEYLRWRYEQRSLMGLAELEKRVFRGTPYEYATYGTPKTLLHLEYEDMQRHLMTQAYGVVVMSSAGDIECAKLGRVTGPAESTADGHSSPARTEMSDSASSHPSSATPSACLVRGYGSAGAFHCLGFPIPSLTDPEYEHLCLLNLRLAGSSTGLSVLRRKLRDSFSLYEVHSALTQYRHRNLLWIRWLVHDGCQADSAALLDLVRKEIGELAESMDDAILHGLRRLWERQHRRSMQGIVAQTTTKAYHELGGLGNDFSQQFASRVADINLSQVEKTATRYLVLPLDRLAIYDLGPKTQDLGPKTEREVP